MPGLRASMSFPRQSGIRRQIRLPDRLHHHKAAMPATCGEATPATPASSGLASGHEIMSRPGAVIPVAVREARHAVSVPKRIGIERAYRERCRRRWPEGSPKRCARNRRPGWRSFPPAATTIAPPVSSACAALRQADRATGCWRSKLRALRLWQARAAGPFEPILKRCCEVEADRH